MSCHPARVDVHHHHHHLHDSHGDKIGHWFVHVGHRTKIRRQVKYAMDSTMYRIGRNVPKCGSFGQRKRIIHAHRIMRRCVLGKGNGNNNATPVSPLRNNKVKMEVTARAAVTNEALPMRIGHGFDLHRLEPGYKLIIGGLDIPHDRGCVAHSDGDVLLHCIVDSILGALCLNDIGQMFPDNDPKWKGAPSDIFMKEAVRLCEEQGYRVGNLDATIIAQRPKLSPHKETIRKNVADLLKVDPSLVNIKAKTHEGVDSLGENRSIACHSVVLLLRK